MEAYGEFKNCHCPADSGTTRYPVKLVYKACISGCHKAG